MAKNAFAVLRKPVWTLENPPHGVTRKACEAFEVENRHLDGEIRIIDQIGGSCSVTTTRSREIAIEAIRGKGNVVVNARS